MAATRPASQLASQAAKSLKRVVADNRPQETPTPPAAGSARRSFIETRGW